MRICIKSPLPKRVADYDDGVRSRNSALFGCECSAKQWSDTKIGEVVARDQFGCSGLWLRRIPTTGSIDQDVMWPTGGHEARKNVVVLAAVGVFGIGKGILDIAAVPLLEPSL